MSFLIRRFAATVLMPLPVALALAIVGAVLWARGRRPRLGKAMLGLGLLLLTVLSLPPVATSLAGRLEHDFPAFPGDSVDYVVVLGSGHVSDPSVPVSARLSGVGIYRLVEGVRIATDQPWSTLVLSGYGGIDPRSNAEVYRDLAVALGFPEERTRVEPHPRTTQEEAELLAPLLRGHRFALVTSANHMPRAAALFRTRGLDPVPAPTGYLSLHPSGLQAMDLVPDEGALVISRQAWYEFLSRAWASLHGDLGP